jgi:hypothetical protein
MNVKRNLMTAKEQLLQELISVPDNLIVETLNFVRFLKTKEQFIEGDAPRTNLATAAEMMGDFYPEGSELTEFTIRASVPKGNRSTEDFSEYESLPENLQVRLAKLQDFIVSRAQQQPSPEAAAFFERFKENLDAEREPERKLFHQNYET